MSNPWLLPDGVEGLLPGDAMRLEQLRRDLIDLCRGHGYDLVSPPLLERLDSLLTGGGEDLDLETFKLTDHESGRQLGIRADMTPQIARIDAILPRNDHPTRLCYAGPALRARPEQAFENRELFQLGAELYGSDRPRADVEVIDLMIQCLERCGLAGAHLDIGHVGVFRALAAHAGLNADAEASLFEALQRKSVPDLKILVAALELPAELSSALVSLPELCGPLARLDESLASLQAFESEIGAAARNLREVAALLERRHRRLDVYFDLSELRGYHYHTGVVFSAFYEGVGREIARGGRYDSIGAAPGDSRPATGFSLDLRRILALRAAELPGRKCIFAPAFADDHGLERAVEDLRASGERVVRALDPDRPESPPPCCDRELVASADGWSVIEARRA